MTQSRWFRIFTFSKSALLRVVLIVLLMSQAADERQAENVDSASNQEVESQFGDQPRSFRGAFETSVASAPVMFTHQMQQQPQSAPQQQIRWPNHQQQQQLQQVHQGQASVSDEQVTRLLSQANEPSSMPANQPAINQDDARRLEQYMINYPRYLDNVDQLNLATINNRPLAVSPQPSSPSPNLVRWMPNTNGDNSRRQMLQVPRQQPAMERSDQNFRERQAKVGDGGRLGQIERQDTMAMTRQGRVDDVLLFNKGGVHNSHDRYSAHPSSPKVLKKLVHDHIGHAPLPPGCIGRAASYTSTCEDHLIKRLNQDATEGRTVLDVSRRVCCALFWHKDCISRVVVDLCPDSNPAAADILLGSRNLDLTMSCQQFNRDGCNGAPPGLSLPNFGQMVFVVILTLALLVDLNTPIHLGDIHM